MSAARRIYLFFLDIAQTVLLAACVFVVIYFFLFRPYQVSGLSMYPTFKDGEYILTSLISLKVGGLHQGDVIVFHAPPDVDPEKDFIKRIVGMPGDTVMVKNGDVYVDGRKFDESRYLQPDVRTLAGAFLKENQVVTVPPDDYFVMGDNRPDSSDSRSWGFVMKKWVIGKSFFVYWPVSHARRVVNPFKK
jgi:signal peptidase I